MEEMESVRISTTVDEDRIRVEISTDREYVEQNFNYLIAGLKDLRKCVANPNDFALTTNARILLGVVSKAPPTEMESKFIEDENALIDEEDKARMLHERALEELEMVNEALEAYEERYVKLLDLLSKEVDRAKVRTMASDAAALKENISEYRTRRDKLQEDAIPTLNANIDGVKAKLKALRVTSETGASDPLRLLLSVHGTTLPYPLSIEQPSNLLRIKRGVITELKSILSQMRGVSSLMNDAERSIFPRGTGLVGATFELDFENYQKTEMARVIQHVYELALEMKELRDGRGQVRDGESQSEAQERKSTTSYRIYRMSDDSIMVTNNALQREMHKLNLITLAGYDPIVWAQSFGVPISGIAKRILDEWDNGSYGPLKPDNVRSLFRGDTQELPLNIDYTTLSVGSRAEELNELNALVKLTDPQQPRPKVNMERELEQLDGSRDTDE